MKLQQSRKSTRTQGFFGLMHASTLNHVPELMDTLSSSFKTNLSKKEITSLIRSQILKKSNLTLQQIQVSGNEDTVVSPAFGFEEFVMVPNEDTVKDARSLIEKLFDNQTITQEDIDHHNAMVNP